MYFIKRFEILEVLSTKYYNHSAKYTLCDILIFVLCRAYETKAYDHPPDEEEFEFSLRKAGN